jgi:hypothetical protein
VRNAAPKFHRAAPWCWVLRHIRVASKAELKSRILAYLDDVNSEPVIHTWTYKIGQAA